MIDVVIPTRNLDRAQAAVDSVRPFADSVVLVMRPEWGYTQAVDDGWRATRSEFVLFLNDDCVVSERALKEMLALLRDPTVGIVGPTLNCGDFQRSKENAPKQDGKYPLAMTVRHLIGACLLVRREVLEKLDGWDTDFVLHCSDLDLCIRAQDAGYHCVWAVQVEVEHESRKTIEEMPPEVRREIIIRDHWLFVKKHPHERYTKHGIQVQMGIPEGNLVLYDLPPTPALTGA